MDQFRKNMKLELQYLMNFHWNSARNYRIEISLEDFADVYILIKDIPPEDVRKAALSSLYKFNVYQIKVKPTFQATLLANSDWMKILDERGGYATI